VSIDCVVILQKAYPTFYLSAMKNLLTAVLPALALFALGGCASTAALTSTEDDGVYYSSKDRTTAVVSAPAPANTSEEANPDYHGSTTERSTARQGSSSDEYYDNTYTYMRGVPRYGSTVYYGPGLATYVPYSPYTTIICSGYGPYGYGGCGYSPYAYGFADPFYSPYYSPYYYGSGVSISFGFGRPYYGGYYGYGRPYGYGYGGGFYDPYYYYGGPYYGGYYGRGGYYGNNYYGGRSYYGGNYYGGNTRYRTSGHRNDRMSDGRYSSGSAAPAGNTTASTPSGGGRTRRDDLVAPGTNTQATTLESLSTRRTRSEAAAVAPDAGSYNQPRRIERSEPASVSQPVLDQPQRLSGMSQEPDRADQRDVRERRRNTMETMSQNNTPEPVAQPQDTPRRRGGFFQNMGGQAQPSDNSGQMVSQPERQRSYERPQRTYEQPQRSYEQPQRVSEPQRSYSQPSYSSPSNNGGGGGGHSRGRGD